MRKFLLLLALSVVEIVAVVAQTVTDSVEITIKTTIGYEIGIDGNMSFNNEMTTTVPVGSHEVKVVNSSGFSHTFPLEVTRQGDHVYSFPVTGKLHVNTEPDGASVYVDKIYRGVTPLSLELTGKHTIRVEKDTKKWDAEERVVDVEVMSEENLDVLLQRREYVKDSHAYLEFDYQLLNFSGYGAAFGGYINKFNMELGCMLGGQKKDVYWYGPSGSKAATITYKTDRTHLKLGYGFKVGHRFQITPQVGGAFLRLSEYDGYGTSSVIEFASDTYAMQWTGSLRMTYALFRYLQLVVTPEYTGTFKEGPLFEKLSSMSEDINRWGNGFNVKVGLTIYIN